MNAQALHQQRNSVAATAMMDDQDDLTNTSGAGTSPSSPATGGNVAIEVEEQGPVFSDNVEFEDDARFELLEEKVDPDFEPPEEQVSPPFDSTMTKDKTTDTLFSMNRFFSMQSSWDSIWQRIGTCFGLRGTG